MDGILALLTWPVRQASLPCFQHGILRGAIANTKNAAGPIPQKDAEDVHGFDCLRKTSDPSSKYGTLSDVMFVLCRSTRQ
jgi:hypothetical protein